MGGGGSDGSQALGQLSSTLEESVKQYEQDLARRLYQARQQAAGQGPVMRAPGPAGQARMKSLEQDALKAQMVIAKSKEGKKRSTLEQLAETPSPAPTPSPTPLEDGSSRSIASPGRLSMPEKKFVYREFAAIPSSKPVYEIQTPDGGRACRLLHNASGSVSQEKDGEAEDQEVLAPHGPSTPSASPREELGLFSSKHKLRHAQHSLETAVPT
ncbi:UNVERIFIED_CONTAM: hypothetical protein K2H54_000581 [Gekko kuhli]